MVQSQSLAQLEHKVGVAELQARTMAAAGRVDPDVLLRTETLALDINRSLIENTPESHSLAVPLLFSLRVRLSAALEEMRQAANYRKAA